MSSVVHFKFRSSVASDVIHFNGHEISVKDLKDEIAKTKKLDKFMEEYDLFITSDETNKEYRLEDKIQKNSSVIVARIPIARNKKGPKHKPEVSPVKIVDEGTTLECISKMADVASMNMSEEDKLSTVMDQSTQEFTVHNKKKNPTGAPPKNYVCHKCYVPGHYIHDCPKPRDKNRDDVPKVKMSSGIPRSFLTVVEDINTPGVLLTSTGELVVHKIDAEILGSKNEAPKVEDCETANILPNDWLCPICKELQTDSVILPCCKKSACDNCVITKLLQSNCPKCPICKRDGVSIANVVQNEELRKCISDHNNNLTNSNSITSFSKIAPVQNSGIKIESEEMKVKVERSDSSSEDDLNEMKTCTENIAPISSMAPTAPLCSFNQIPVRYSAPLSVQNQNFQHTTAQHGAMIQQGLNNLPLNMLLYSGGIHPSYLYQYGAQLGAFTNGVIPFPGLPGGPMSEEQFYMQQKQLRERNGRYRRSPHSPRRNRSPRRRDDDYERRQGKRRSRSRSYERSRSRSRNHKYSNKQYSPRNRRSTSRDKKHRTPDSQSSNRSFSLRNEMPEKIYKLSSRRNESPNISRGRSITPDRKETRRYSRSPMYRSRSRSNQRFYDRSMSPQNKRHSNRDVPLVKLTKKIVKRVSDDHDRSPSPPQKRIKNSPKINLSTYDLPRQRSRSPRRKHHTRESSQSKDIVEPRFKVGKRNERMEDSIDPYELKAREKRLEKNDLRDIIKDNRAPKEFKNKEITRPKERVNADRCVTKQESKYYEENKSYLSKDNKGKNNRKDIIKEKSYSNKTTRDTEDRYSDIKYKVQKVNQNERKQEKSQPLKEISTRYEEQAVSRAPKSNVAYKKNYEKESDSKQRFSHVNYESRSNDDDDDEYKSKVKKYRT